MTVSPIPESCPRISPYLIVPGVERVIAFMEDVLGGALVQRHDMPDGSIMHAEVRVGDSVVMMGEAGGTMTPVPAALHVYVPDVDAAFERAVALGLQVLEHPTDKFYGSRSASVRDTSGNLWFLAMRTEILSEEEMQRRSAEEMERRTSRG